MSDILSPGRFCMSLEDRPLEEEAEKTGDQLRAR
jgi:hypothetical protein